MIIENKCKDIKAQSFRLDGRFTGMEKGAFCFENEVREFEFDIVDPDKKSELIKMLSINSAYSICWDDQKESLSIKLLEVLCPLGGTCADLECVDDCKRIDKNKTND